MRNIIGLIVISLVFFAGCSAKEIEDNSNKEIIMFEKTTFAAGEDVRFTISPGTPQCKDRVAYSICIKEGKCLEIPHPCASPSDSGKNCYCEDGKMSCVQAEGTNSRCSEIYTCTAKQESWDFVWDQKIFVMTGEDCGSQKAISFEGIQASAGKYVIKSYDPNGNEVEKDFEII